MKKEIAYFGAGCFWHPQSVFDKTKGIIETVVGYMGGKVKNPTYRLVCTGNTGHAETVKVIYDPSKINYKKLLEIFFKIHDPTQKNRQGPDKGTQYRSVIFYTNENQNKVAKNFIKEFQKKLKEKKIQTELKKATKLYIAEDYHQKYLKKNSYPAATK